MQSKAILTRKWRESAFEPVRLKAFATKNLRIAERRK
jgi:hypothetical protein